MPSLHQITNVGALGGSGGTLREGADFLGDDGEPGPGLAGAGGLDGGVERQDVGLVSIIS